MVQVPGLKDEMWTPEHDIIITNFLTQKDVKILVVFIDESNNLIIKHEIPTFGASSFSYFVKSYYTEEISKKETFSKYVQYGNFNGKQLLSLLRLTSGLYAPMFFGNKTWPDSKILVYSP